MQVKEVVQLICPRVFQHCKKLKEIADPLSKLEIDGFTYTMFKDLPNNNRIRTSFFYSDESFLETYSNKIGDLEDSAFIENHNDPIHKNAIYNYFDKKYSAGDDAVLDITRNFGINNAIGISLRDNFNRKSELYCFYSKNSNPEWFMQQIDNLSILNKFSLYLKDQARDFIVTPHLNEEELKAFSQTKTILLDPNQESDDDYFDIKEYYFGYPFNAPLTKREVEILKLYFRGNSAKQIALAYKISKRTVEKCIENIRLKTCCSNLKELRQSLFECALFYRLIMQ